MPAMIPAAVGASAIGTAAIGGTALGAGLTAGAALAGGAGIAGLMGGLGGLGGAVAPGAFGALAPSVATTIAPAAAAQAAGTIGTLGGSVAPGAFGANLAGASQGLASTLPGTVSPGAFGANLASTLPGAVNPAAIQAEGAKFLAQSQAAGMPIAKPFGAETMLADTSTKIAPNAFQQMPDLAAQMQMEQLKSAGVSALPADTAGMSGVMPGQNFLQNIGNFFQNPSMQGVKDYAAEHPYATAGMAGLGALGLKKLFEQQSVKAPESNAMIRPYTYERTQRPEAYETSSGPGMDSSERLYFDDQFVAGTPYRAVGKAGGGITNLAVGGPIEQMSAMNAVGGNTGYPMANLQTPMYSNPAMQRPEATNVIAPSADAGVGAYSGEPRFAEGGEAKTEGGYKYSYDPQTMQFTQLGVPTIAVAGPATATGGMMNIGLPPTITRRPVTNSGSVMSGGIATPAMGPMQTQQAAPTNVPPYQSPEQQLGLTDFYSMMDQRLAGYGGYGGFAAGGNVGGEANLGSYSDGGRLLRGPGDGVSDSIPASIGDRQPARLADGEFVVPARIVSEIGNGSTEAGARKLYAMMDRVQKARRKTVGKDQVARNTKADKYLPA